jgi:hypothetical protein
MDQRPHAAADVSPRGFYELTHSDLPYSFLNLLDTANLDESVTPSLFRRESLPDVRLGQHVQVSLNLFSELLVHAVLVEQVAPEAGQARNQRHDCFSSGSF